MARLVKDHFAATGIRANSGLPVPIAAVGKLGYPDLAERALREGYCDMIMLGRPLLADPEWPNKAYAGRVEEICPCIGDQEACLNEFLEGGQVQCAVNARTGFEDTLCADPEVSAQPANVAVVGGGPAGITCACMAAQRGHRVTLFEKESEVGGWLIAGSAPRIKYDVANYLQYLRHFLERTADRCSLEARLGVEATAALLKTAHFDAVVTCTGARPAGLPVEGADKAHVIQAVDFMLRPGLAATAHKVMVVGGGSVGCEAAYMLAYELHKEVTVVEILPHIMKGVCTANRGHLIHYLEKKGTRFLNCTKVRSIGSGSVRLARNTSPTVPDPYNTWSPLLPDNIKNPLARKIRLQEREIEVEADLVVPALGLRPDSRLYEECLSEQIAPRIYNVGDSFCVGRVFEAVKAGHAIGRAI